jgi:hypothetical protein
MKNTRTAQKQRAVHLLFYVFITLFSSSLPINFPSFAAAFRLPNALDLHRCFSRRNAPRLLLGESLASTSPASF